MSSEATPGATPTIELVRLTQAGRVEAREELFARYGARILSIVRMRLGAKLRERIDSVDIAQDVMADAFGRLDDFEMRDESSLMRWLARIVENKIRNQAAYHGAAKRDAGGELALDAPIGAGADSGARLEVPGSLPTPSVELGRAEEADRVRDAIAALPDRYRETILLRDYTGASWSDVATEIGVKTADAARMLYSRALSRLGEELRRTGVS